jgi:hypothetical protein
LLALARASAAYMQAVAAPVVPPATPSQSQCLASSGGMPCTPATTSVDRAVPMDTQAADTAGGVRGRSPALTVRYTAMQTAEARARAAPRVVTWTARPAVTTPAAPAHARTTDRRRSGPRRTRPMTTSMSTTIAG